MSDPAVSVILPVHNVERFVAEAVRSVLDQTFADWELIAVDDGGSDRSIAIVERFDDARIRIVAQANRGLAGARNTGILAARGRYLALLDADDRWHADKLLLHVIHLDANAHVDVSYAGSRLIDVDGVPLKTAMRPKLTGVTAADILLRNPVGNGSAAVLRRAGVMAAAVPHPVETGRLCLFDERFRQSEDIELWLRLAAGHSCVFEGIDGLLTDYRVVGGGLSGNIVRQYDSWAQAVALAEGYAPELLAQHGAAARAYQLRYLARRAVQLGDHPLARSLMAQALATSRRILWAEPRKTLETAAAAAATRVLPPALFGRLTRRHTGAVA